eukprot:c15554_g1_i3 orf=1029-4460(+)
MEKGSDDEGAALEDGPPDDFNEEGSEFVEMDPTGRYGRYNEVLGKGAYKTVYKAFDDLDGIEVAWNQVKIHDVLQNAGDIERLYSELHLLKTLKHKNIIKFYNSWVDNRSKNVNFITEIFTSGTLRQYRKKHKNVNFITEIFTSGTLRQYRKKHKHVNLRAIKHWSRQILRGLVFLHSRDPPIIHRDLKCDNIFINGNNGEVKIGDLGLATILRRAPAAQSVIGTPEFMAPELYEEHYNELVDIYSFGMCLLEMLTSEYPYSECTNAAQIYRKVTMGKRPAALGKVKDPETREFVEKCLASVSQRLHARELLMDPFLRSDEDLETLEQSRCSVLNPYGDLQGLDPIPEDSHFRSADFLLSAQKLDEVSESSQLSFSRKEGISRHGPGSSEKLHALDSSSPKEGLKRCKDFRIKGRKQDDKKVLVRIRIASSGGEVRVIQFDFDVEADTAMSVASEMVTELDLSDQDVTTIADMIDAEIMALIPDWKPGLALDEAVDDYANEQKGLVVDNSHEQEGRDDDLTVVDTPAIMSGLSDDPQLASGPTYGRFEEVGCNAIGSDHQQQESDGLGFFSDFSSEQFEGSGSDSSLDARSSIETGVDNDFTIQSYEGVETGFKSDSLPSSSGNLPKNMEAEAKEKHLPFLGSDDKLDDSEVSRLIVLQQEELQNLQSKHELALLDLKRRLTQDAVTTGDKVLPSDSATFEITNDLVQSCGSPERLYEEMRSPSSEVGVDPVEPASCIPNFISTSTGPSAILDTSEGAGLAISKLTEGLSQAENISTVLMSTFDLARGSHDMDISEIYANALKANESLGALVRSKIMLNEVAGLEDFHKKAPVCTGGDFKGAVDEIVSDLLTESKLKPCTHNTDKGAQVSRATIELNGPENRCTPASHEDAKPGLAFAAKRESYLELYKASNNKDKVSSSKLSELVGTGDEAFKMSNPKDANQEQLKKQQLQKSIADLEAKTLENLSQSKNKYLLTTAVKNLSGAPAQNGQQGAAVKNLAGATIQNGQQGATVKNLPGATIQNGQQGATSKSFSGTAYANVQQGATAKSHPSSTPQNGATGKSLPASTQNGQQSGPVKNLTGAPVQSGQQGSTVKNQPGASLQTGQQGASAKNHAGANVQNGQQGSTAGHARQQHIPTETTRA